MLELSNLIVAAFSAILATAAAESPDARTTGEASQTIYMFGASWCAPCIAELRNIGSLATAASPDRIVIVWSDSGIGRFRLPANANVEVADASTRRLAARLAGQARTGLPYSAFIDSQGKKCAEWRGGLTPETIARLRKACTARAAAG